MLVTDSNGEIINEISLGGTGLDFAYDAIEATDGSMLLVGETASDNFPKIDHKGGADLIVAKIN